MIYSHFSSSYLGIPTSEVKSRGSHTVEALSPKDIEAMRVVCKVSLWFLLSFSTFSPFVEQIGREVLDIAGAAVKVGITTDEIDRIVHEATIERNAYPLSFLSLLSTSLCSSD